MDERFYFVKYGLEILIGQTIIESSFMYIPDESKDHACNSVRMSIEEDQKLNVIKHLLQYPRCLN
jgi:hypothetical protein